MVLVIQAERGGSDGPSLEAKCFLSWSAEWRMPFWERVSLETWAEPDLGAAFAAWTAAHEGAPLRATLDEQDGALELSLRTRDGGLALTSTGLIAVGEGVDPHGEVRWSAGSGALIVNGARVDGTVVVEQLGPGAEPHPRFGEFEMWWLRWADSTVELGRHHPGRPGGQALRIGPTGAALQPFAAATTASRIDDVSGYALPVAWTVQGTPVARTGGELGRGHSPDGAPAVFDISHASGDGVSGLVFHLQDGP